jgi:hypothetical protein
VYLPFKIIAVITHMIVGVGSGTVHRDSGVWCFDSFLSGNWSDLPYNKVCFYLLRLIKTEYPHLVCVDMGRLSPSFDHLWPDIRLCIAGLS